MGSKPADKPKVVIGLLGTQLDGGTKPERWERWRPTVAICQSEEFEVARLELLHERRFQKLADVVAADVRQVSPQTEVRHHLVEYGDPWDFSQVFEALHDFVRGYEFRTDAEDYLAHITTGTHVAQICIFLLTESRHLPARLLQSSPPVRGAAAPGPMQVIDLDLGRYDAIARRFERERHDAAQILKSGIPTRSARFNRLIEQVEHVALNTRAPILLLGPTGAGKSRLAGRIFELKRQRHRLDGPFVEVNCATLRGDAAMSALFGHRKGAFTGAVSDRAGLLRNAHLGVLFLDEIGDLGLDEQAMLLRALEEKRFLPVGADTEVASDFELLAGTNRDLRAEAAAGRFRSDLLARINVWTFELPGLSERREDLEPNIDFELEGFARASGRQVRFNREARALYLEFAGSAEARWSGGFRDLNGSVTRMATLAAGGRIDEAVVRQEIERLRRDWGPCAAVPAEDDGLATLLGGEAAAALDRFDRIQLAEVVRVCRACRTLSDAGRRLFAASRSRKDNPNDADRLRKYLARFGLEFASLRP